MVTHAPLPPAPLTQDDLWVIIKGKVYDVTSYVEEHPGGLAIMNNAGRDSTEGFYGPQHPGRVFHMMDEYLIGVLDGPPQPAASTKKER